MTAHADKATLDLNLGIGQVEIRQCLLVDDDVHAVAVDGEFADASVRGAVGFGDQAVGVVAQSHVLVVPRFESRLEDQRAAGPVVPLSDGCDQAHLVIYAGYPCDELDRHGGNATMPIRHAGYGAVGATSSR